MSVQQILGYSIREPVAVAQPVMVGPPFAGTNTTEAEGVSKVFGSVPITIFCVIVCVFRQLSVQRNEGGGNRTIGLATRDAPHSVAVPTNSWKKHWIGRRLQQSSPCENVSSEKKGSPIASPV